jgi:hypothetical protein
VSVVLLSLGTSSDPCCGSPEAYLTIRVTIHELFTADHHLSAVTGLPTFFLLSLSLHIASCFLNDCATPPVPSP